MKRLFFLSLALLAWTACGTSTTKDNDPWGNVDPSEANKRSSVVEFSMTSKAMNRKMYCQVWLPANYDKTKTYPFLYLLHGYETNDQNGRFDRYWNEKGNASRIADDYQKSGGVPMVIVMPNGLDKFYVSDGYEKYFEEELIAAVEAEYKCNGKRAIAGLSMGGFGTFYHAIAYHDKFTYAYAMSPATNIDWRLYGIDFYINMIEVFNSQADKTHFPAFTIELGKQDNTVSNADAKALANHMVRNGITCEVIERDGIHYWDFWQECLPKALKKVGESCNK